MNNRQILAAALRWHTFNTQRLAIGAEQRRYTQANKRNNGFSGASCEIGQRLTAIKRIELAALRELAGLCAKVRSSQHDVVDAAVVAPPVVLLGD